MGDLHGNNLDQTDMMRPKKVKVGYNGGDEQ